MNHQACPVCGIDSLHLSGSHLYCQNEKCIYVAFTVTDVYIEACKVLLGALISNTEYTDERGYVAHIHYLIEKHLPMLNNYINQISEGTYEFIKKIADDVVPHAINTTIGPVKHNIEELPNDLKCSCGCSDFSRYKDLLSQLHCRACGALFLFNIDTNRYMPEFICYKCGSNKYIDDGDELIVSCSNCHAGHWKKGLKPIT